MTNTIENRLAYLVYVSDAYYIENDGVLDWATDVDKSLPQFTKKLVEKHHTVAEAMKSMSDWGSRWVMYPSVVIENSEGEEVWSSYPVLHKCKCCKREEYDTVEGGLYTMRNKDGSKLFPEIV